ncbi:BH3 interacting domain death agonist [Pempheris klunzingeri]|uniref:BH3 interacting domain death agonist n=1 Tax=Pempheris klunzingeri TaxID=3127111 RepID=UPI0039803609
MDDLGNLISGENAALVCLVFLQADCSNAEYRKGLLSLGKDMHLTRDINCNGAGTDALDDGDLETDGYMPSCTSAFPNDFLPVVDLQGLRNHEEAAALQQVAEDLRQIAALLEHNAVARATHNLSRNISTSRYDQWKDHLTQEVERVMSQGVGLEHLHRERVIMALTLTLVKSVCEQTPRLLRRLFNIALQYLNPGRAR